MTKRKLVQQIFDIGVDQKLFLKEGVRKGEGALAKQIRDALDFWIARKKPVSDAQTIIGMIDAKITLLQAYTDSAEVRVVIANLEQLKQEVKDKLIL